MNLAYTGERVIPDRFHIQDRILQEHLDRYRYAARQLRQFIDEHRERPNASLIDAAMPLMVLDLPCGVGYGSALIAEQVGASVYGIDIDEETIEYAREKYGDNLTKDYGCTTFMTGDMIDEVNWPYLPLMDATVCFEGIEHVDDQKFAARRIAQVTREGGLIFVSTPRRDGPGGGSEYHTRELTQRELIDLFLPYVYNYKVVGQELRVEDCAADDNARFYILVGRRNANV
jgi:2-polyprenyl-3-methyl-5-hydroxy-6-metoxy-1,4-benzoquinol methylase